MPYELNIPIGKNGKTLTIRITRNRLTALIVAVCSLLWFTGYLTQQPERCQVSLIYWLIQHMPEITLFKWSFLGSCREVPLREELLYAWNGILAGMFMAGSVVVLVFLSKKRWLTYTTIVTMSLFVLLQSSYFSGLLDKEPLTGMLVRVLFIVGMAVAIWYGRRTYNVAVIKTA